MGKESIYPAHTRSSPAITAKLLKVAQGTERVDERDAPAFQKVYGPEDLIAERIRHSNEESEDISVNVYWHVSATTNHGWKNRI
jgi:hypothetical protein